MKWQDFREVWPSQDHGNLEGFHGHAGGFAFEQDLQNVARFHQAVKLGKPNAFSGSLAELLICCTRHVDKNFHVPAWKHRFWRSDVQASRRQYREWQASAIDSWSQLNAT